MKNSGNHALNHFLATAALTSWSGNTIFASARIGHGPQRAPISKGFDPTAPLEKRDPEILMRARIDKKGQPHFFDRPSVQTIDEALKIVLADGEESVLRNVNLENTTRTSILHQVNPENSTKPATVSTTKSTDDDHLVDQLDFGILQHSVGGTAPASVPSRHTSTPPKPSTTCMMGFDKDRLQPANTYLQSKIDEGRFEFSQILFDEASNTVFCNQKNDLEEDVGDSHHHYGCASMHFRGCKTVKCNGQQSCIDATIEEAQTIECEGYESCRDARLDAITVDCGGEAACMSANIGFNQFVQTLDCHSGESACAYAATESVGSVFCTGPLSCYGAELTGVTNGVTCQGVPHPHSFYMPTCGGGDSGTIRAEAGQSIDVVCDGDFACIGNGANDKDRSPYFDIDVGKDGHLTCGGSLVGNQDGFTFVCKYLDVTQGCSTYDCNEPSFALVDHGLPGIDGSELRTCNKIVSVNQNEQCSEDDDVLDEDFDDEDDDDDSDDDDDDDDDDDEDDDDDDDEDDSDDRR